MKPLILITNDDGVMSPGLKAVAETVIDFADVLIAAPVKQQTSMGRSFPKSDDVGIIDSVEMYINGNVIVAYGVHGAPATAVSHAVLELTPRKIDLCISGINYGENLGLGLSCSGTVGAALEANTYNIPAIAISLEAVLESQHSNEFSELDWTQCKRAIRYFAKKILRDGLDEKTALININIPIDATNDTKYELTRQSKQNYFFFKKPDRRNFSEKFRLQSYIEVDYNTLEEDSDINCFVKRRNISITPVTWDMTSYTRYKL